MNEVKSASSYWDIWMDGNSPASACRQYLRLVPHRYLPNVLWLLPSRPKPSSKDLISKLSVSTQTTIGILNFQNLAYETRKVARVLTFWISKAILLSKYLTSLSSTKFFLDWAEIRALRSRRRFWARGVRAAGQYMWHEVCLLKRHSPVTASESTDRDIQSILCWISPPE